MTAYNPNIPTATDFLSDSQVDLRNNFSQANTTYVTDHIAFDVAPNNGYHKDIHIVKRTGNPAVVADTVIGYVKDYTPDTTGGVADTQLFSETAAGVISQLTGKLTGNDGWAWVGGILVQWGINTAVTSGTFASGTATGTVTFKDRVAGAIPFPTACFVVIPGTRNNAAPSGSRYVGVTVITKSTTNFTWSANGSSSAANGFFWIAIGN